jgi:hypothetical protein
MARAKLRYDSALAARLFLLFPFFLRDPKKKQKAKEKYGKEKRQYHRECGKYPWAFSCLKC